MLSPLAWNSRSHLRHRLLRSPLTGNFVPCLWAACSPTMLAFSRSRFCLWFFIFYFYFLFFYFHTNEKGPFIAGNKIQPTPSRNGQGEKRKKTRRKEILFMISMGHTSGAHTEMSRTGLKGTEGVWGRLSSFGNDPLIHIPGLHSANFCNAWPTCDTCDLPSFQQLELKLSFGHALGARVKHPRARTPRVAQGHYS
jgi:hypothetical protein